MRQVIKKVLWIGLLALGPQAAWAFSLLGPSAAYTGLPTGFGDAWEVATIGYNPLGGGPPFFTDGQPSGPKNLAEEYRRNTPVMYYAANATFLDFFGSNGVVAIDQAYAILNALTNVDRYSAGLTEFSLNTIGVNYQAEALQLRDLKTTILTFMAEQLGLADAVRYTWALHDRYTPPGATCPTEWYSVIQRNFDLIASPLNQIQYSPYVNGELYSYYIYEICSGAPTLADALEIPTDPLFNNPPVASGHGVDWLDLGQFYTGLTRDDVAGLRYLLTTNNLNIESAAAGSQLWVTNLPSPQLVTTTNLGLFLLQAQTLDPAALQTLYPGLIITGTITNFTFAITTNVTAFYTNQPGPAVTNYTPPILWTNYDLATLNALAQTSPPAALLAAYPGLYIVNYSSYFTNIPIPVVVSFLEPWIGGPAGSSRIVIQTNDYLPNILTYYTYTFGNLLTNSYYPSNKISVVTTWFTNLIGAPYTSPLVLLSTTNTSWVKSPSGDFFIVPTNWCGYQVLSVLWTNTLAVTNSLPITTTNGTTAVTNGSTAFIVAQYSQWTYTNRIYAVQPGICEPTLVFATNVTGAIVTSYQETFANVVTNSYFTNSLVTVLTTNIGPCAGGLTNVLCTNITSVTFLTNTPSGDFWIVPAAWNCGYIILSVPFTNTIVTTNTILTATIPPGIANIGQQYSVTLISSYTNHSLLIQPILCLTATSGPALYQGIGRMQFVRVNYDSLLGQLFQPVTNLYPMVFVTNSHAGVQYFQRIVTTPDFLFSAADLASGPAALPVNVWVSRSLSFNIANIYPGLAGPGTINPGTSFTFNKVGPVYFNIGPTYLTGPNNPSNLNRLALYFLWGSFDGSTNDPVVYPNGTSLANLAAEVLIQISPTSLPNGTNGVAYPTVTLSATGGQAPYTWTLTSGSALPPGLNLSSGGVISGTPTQSGAYVVTVQMTDAASRTVAVNYSITIN